jgi:hypothetical protein
MTNRSLKARDAFLLLWAEPEHFLRFLSRGGVILGAEVKKGHHH